MAATHIPERRFRQPAHLVGVHPDWEGRVVSLLHFGAGAPVDVADRRIYVPLGAAKTEPAAPGIAGWRTGAGGATSGYIEASGAMAGWSGNPTIVFFFPEIGTTQDGNGGMLYAIPAASSYTQITSGGQLFFAGNGPYTLPEEIRGTRNKTLILRGAGADPAFFTDMKKAPGIAATIPSGPKTVRLGAWSSNGWQFNGVYGSVAVIAGAITDDEAYQLVDNPWMLYEADSDALYFDLGAGGGTSQDLAASGAATATGAASPALNVALAGVGVSLASGSASIAASRPLAASGASSASGTATPKIDIALSALGLTVASGTAALSSNASGSLGAAGSATAGGSAAAVANVSISAAGLAQAAAQAGLAASVLLAGAGAAAASGNAALAVQLQALAQGAAQASGTAALQGSTAGQLSASGQATAGGTAALRLDVRLQAAGGAQAGGSGTLSAGDAATLAASGGAASSGSGALSAAISLTAAGFVQAMGAGYLVVQVSLAAAGAASAGGAAALVDADALVLIEMPRWAVDAPGRRWVVQ